MDLGGGHQVGAVGGVIAVQIGGVLEVVGVQRTVGQGAVGQHIVVIDHDLQVVALFGQSVLHLLQDLGVRGGAGAHGDGLQVAGLGDGGAGGVRAGAGHGGGAAALAGAAGKRAQGQHEGQGKSKFLLHF